MLSCRSGLVVPVVAVLLAIATAAPAQSPAAGAQPRTGAGSSAAAAAPNPGDARADVPAVVYSSAFTRYRPNAEAELGNWRGSNDNVGRIGGWRVYGKEASEPEAPGTPTNEGKAVAQPGGAKPRPEHGRPH